MQHKIPEFNLLREHPYVATDTAVIRSIYSIIDLSCVTINSFYRDMLKRDAISVHIKTQQITGFPLL